MSELVDCLTTFQIIDIYGDLIFESKAPDLKTCIGLALNESVSLRFADFENADLSDFIFTDADLTGANFKGAILTGAEFRRTLLDRTNFKDACLAGATFKQTDLRSIKPDGAITTSTTTFTSCIFPSNKSPFGIEPT